jgi:hypothetical protein
MPFPRVFREQRMSGKSIQPHQLQTYMTARETGCPQQQAAHIKIEPSTMESVE